MTNDLKGKWYQHYKGSYYKVVTEATDTETGEQRIIYCGRVSDKLWDRPKKMFLETMPDGCRRFEPCRNPNHQGQHPTPEDRKRMETDGWVFEPIGDPTDE